MKKPLAYGTLLLLTSHLVAPAALAQVAGAQDSTTPPAGQTVDPEAQDLSEQEVEVSTPGAEAGEDSVIRVTGRNIPNVVRATPQVISVLSADDIARTGEGDIAGALQRVTGLSVVGNGFVFVRGLGDRYSSALLNGSPLPSPEPLRRTVPLDIFPTTIVGSALVQKSYSVNYPGEFGGGVINLTTRAIPDESFVAAGASATFDTETTGELGYVYDGGDTDWLGFDDGTRKVPAWVKNVALNSQFASTDQVATLENAKTTLVQSNYHLPVNWSGDLSFAHSLDLGSTRLGVIGSASVSNSWRTRDALQQDTVTPTGAVRNNYRSVITDNRIVANALLGLGAEFGEHKVRATGVFIHDTLKQARAAFAARDQYTNGGDPIYQTNTNWFERQLIDTQLTGEFKFGDLSVDVRGTYANSKRNSPYERQFTYRLAPCVAPSCTTTNPARLAGETGIFINGLRNSPREVATVAFSELDEDLWSGQVDAAYRLPTTMPITLSTGYYYSDTDRFSERFAFSYTTNVNGTLPIPYSYLRPDHLLSNDVLYNACPSIADGVGAGCIRLLNNTGPQGAGIYEGKLRIHAGYAQAEADVTDGVRVTAGVRYETAKESVLTNTPAFPGTVLDTDHWLPALTATWNFAENMQLRAHGSKTIARPQFRELAPQYYQDFESDRQFFGNPGLKDSVLWNAEARYEWFFARNQRVTAAGFYKKIKNPIEQIASYGASFDSRLQTAFSYAPEAVLWGGEVEVQKYIPLESLGGAFFASRRLLFIANYTYTQSELNVDGSAVPDPLARDPLTGKPVFIPASRIYTDGAPMTGQSDHLVNVQLGIEDTDSLSQLTVLFNYASERVTARGASNLSGVGFLPDVVEKPGIRLDVVARQGIQVLGGEFELKFEARNLTKTEYQEYQQFQNTRVYVNRYDLGRTFSVGISAKF